jgi:3-hydroxyisobutyrate dehydrogenase
MAKIAFLGLGNMGLPMAINLAKAGHELAGFDVAPAAIAAAEAAGLRTAGTAPAAVAGAEIVISMLPNGALLRDLYETVLPHIADGALMIDCSTVDVAAARAAHAGAAARGCASLDAPVSGGTAGAAAATLTFMVGGATAAFARAQPILAAMGKKIVHCGDAGTGQAAKICNNMILGISMIAVAEAFVLAEKLGLSHQALFDVASTASGQCWALTSYCPVPGPVPASPANHDYQPGFAAALMLKDLTLAAQEAGGIAPLGAKAAAIYKDFVDAGAGGRDFSAIIEAIRA